MTIFIGADHRGFELKNKLIEYLQEKDIRVEDMGPYEHDPQDDFPDFAFKVAEAVRQNKDFLGIVICGSGVGVCVAANRLPGIVCGVGFEAGQVKHIRENDHANVLSIPSDYIDFEQAQEFVDIFLATTPKTEEKYLRRLKKLNEKEIKPLPDLAPLEE